MNAVKWNQRDYLGGEGGIRTPEAPFEHPHDFQSCSFSQLGHLSIKCAFSAGGAGIGRFQAHSSPREQRGIIAYCPSRRKFYTSRRHVLKGTGKTKTDAGRLNREDDDKIRFLSGSFGPGETAIRWQASKTAGDPLRNVP